MHMGRNSTTANASLNVYGREQHTAILTDARIVWSSHYEQKHACSIDNSN